MLHGAAVIIRRHQARGVRKRVVVAPIAIA
jgi:hypothetical protein